ncbi:hypothetical protein [Flagellimonas sp. GZD32]|uniref:hypothetical protein n=1 Tax=Flagellimonas cixiensis TaxID=3228750 RepID=UPI0035C9326C
MSIKGKVKNEYSIQYCIEYKDPIEISEFTKSLNGFSNEYKKFVKDNYGHEFPVDAKLHIEKIEEGSVLATLVEYQDLILPFVGEVNTVWEFGKNLKTLYDHFLGNNNKPDDLKYDVKDLQNIADILAPGTHKENKITINVYGDHNNVPVLNADSIDASAMTHRIGQEKKMLETPKSSKYTKQAFYFDQAKKDIGSKSGNFGIIENLYPFRLKVIFEDDKLDKTAMLHGEHNPLMATYIVDVEVQMVKEKPKIYKILKLHEIIHDDDEE